MTLAMLGLGTAAGLSWQDTVRLANLAAGLQVERFGVVPITRGELVSAFTAMSGGAGQPNVYPSDATHLRRSHDKVVALDVLLHKLAGHRRTRQTIVFTNGCFDLLHVGHLRLLEEAKALGNVLVVAVNADASVRQLKGPTRPIIGAEHRAAIVAALTCVDYVLIFDDPTPHRLLEAIRPDVLVKGGSYRRDEVVGREIVEAYGGRVGITSRIDGVSTTQILARVEADRNSDSAVGRPELSSPEEDPLNSARRSVPDDSNPKEAHPDNVPAATELNESPIPLRV
jgi:D-beta-D-heptose 7-phosphate kinase/D-beta-D-heptose 1-phosphate adenosyltransferase